MKRALVYVRVSSREQADEGYSIAAQREACFRYVTEHGWQLADEYVDRGESARTADRPQFQAMLERIKTDDSIAFLVVHKLDRMARNLEDHAMVRALLRKYEVKLVSVTESLEENASGKLVEGILASISEFYSSNLAQEIKKGLLQKVKEGGWPTLAPLGYNNVRIDSPGGRRGESVLVVDPEVAAFVRKAFDLYATGDWSLRTLHAEMTRLGMRNRRGGTLTVSKFSELLKSRAYLGKVPYRGVEYDGKHEPLITPEIFSRVQDVFREHDYAGVRQRRHSHYLRGTVFCGTCGARLSTMLKKNERYEYFYCLGKHGRRTVCDELYMPTDGVERQIERFYASLQIPVEVGRNVERELNLEIALREKYRGRTSEQASKRLVRLAAERDKLLRAYYAKAIPVETLKREQQRIDGEVDAAASQIALAGVKLEAAKKLIEASLKLLSQCGRAYKKAVPADRRKWNHAIIEKVLVSKGQVTSVQIKEPFAVVLAKGSSQGSSRAGSSKNPQVELRGLEPLAPTMPSWCSTN